MIEIRLHGRGGQGAVTAAELVAQAAIASGKYAQGFPNFGPERRGAPVTAFLRVSDEQVYLRERIETPDVVIVLDSTLLGVVDVTEGLPLGSTVIINAPNDKNEAVQKLSSCYQLALVDASKIAIETLGVPITNTAIIGALVQVTGAVPMESLEDPVKNRFGHLAEKNLMAMRSAFQQTTVLEPPESEGDCSLMSPPSWDEYIRGEALHPWDKVEIGCDVHRAGSCEDFHTGNWRTTGRPVMDRGKCVSCGLCWILCPDMAFSPDGEDGYNWDARYCKGCGICVSSCPKDALSMEDE